MADDSSTESTRRLVSGVFERWEADGDPAAFLAALSDDVVWTIAGSSALAGVYQGLQAYRERVYAALAERLETWPVPEVDQLVADGEWAAVRWTGDGGQGRRGEDYSMQYAWWLRVSGDRIHEVIDFYDDLKVTALFA